MSRVMRYGPISGLVHLLLALLLAAPVHASPERPLIWALGDSLTAGYGLPPREGFTEQLERALRGAGVPAEVRNGGVSGDTAAQGRARLLWGLRGLKARPDLVIVELGANDMLRGLPPQQTEANLDRIISELKRRGIPVLLAGMRAAPNLGPQYRARFESIYPRLAKKHGVPLYPFFLEGVAGNRALFQGDGLHPTARGVDVVVRRMLPAVRRALRR
ncbi:arylesterase [Sphingomonas lenta]|uniref:Arylesterase n=1 Tax=Sphingomonas lenta TaxID=1141887 RepID=A0A2A2SES1_9SPHN|nr:arylesterase [Sphingomonas lenta]PAX07757.1 arylesterase [Sphingomonas lenta]